MENQNEASAVIETSSEDDNDSSEDEQDAPNSREKRHLSWCGVPTDHYTPPKKVVVWPPPSSSSSRAHLVNFNNVAGGSAMFGTKMQLYSQNRQHLAIYPDGKVRGTPDENDLHTYLELTSADYVGHVRIRGLLTNLYVAMDKKGRLYGEPNFAEESTVFIESLQGSYNAYLSRKYAHAGWYLGLKKSGKFKKGPKTAYGQKAVKFLPRRSKFQ